MRRFVFLVLMGLGGISGCGRNPDPEALQSALLEADRLFDEATLARGADGWAETFLPAGVMFPPQGRVDGRDAIRERMARAFTPGNPRLRWEPAQAVVAASDDLGYTLGRWKSVGVAADGRDSVLAEGNYVTIWSRDAEGRWRVAVDIGNSDP